MPANSLSPHTDQVQIATEKFVAQIQSRRPTTLQGSSLDFSKPRLVQISMTDVGACMPMTSVVSQVCDGGVTLSFCSCTLHRPHSHSLHWC